MLETNLKNNLSFQVLSGYCVVTFFFWGVFVSPFDYLIVRENLDLWPSLVKTVKLRI